MVRNILQTLHILLGTLMLCTCSDANDKNQLAVYLCDSPADYSGLNFYIAGIDVRQAGSDTWTPLTVSEPYVALLELINGRMQEAGRGTMPKGSSYDAVRITFSTENAYLVLAGESRPLAVDAADASVTVPFPAVTMDGPNSPILFDIDIAASVVEDPTAGSGYRFRPQVTFVDTEACGVVQGGLQAGQAAVTSRLWLRFTDDATGKVSSTYCSLNPAGAFFMRLMPGNYTLEVTPRTGSDIRPYTTKVAVERQQVTDLGIIFLETNGL